MQTEENIRAKLAELDERLKPEEATAMRKSAYLCLVANATALRWVLGEANYEEAL